VADATRPDRRSPRFRRVPFIRDVALDPGRATAPRLTAPHVLPSTDENVSAPAILSLSWLTPTPHIIAVYASPRSSPSAPQHSLPGGRYPLPGPDLHRLELASFSWRTSSSLARRVRLAPSSRDVHRAKATVPALIRTGNFTWVRKAWERARRGSQRMGGLKFRWRAGAFSFLNRSA